MWGNKARSFYTVWCQAGSAENLYMDSCKLRGQVTRILVPVVALAILAACTEVMDFGTYWNRGTVDPALAGRWKKIALPGEPIDDSIPASDLVVFTKSGTFYSLQMINPVDPSLDPEARAERVKYNNERDEAKTLRIRNRNLLMVRDDSGSGAIVRYEIKGNLLEEWILDPVAADEWLEAKHPKVAGIDRNSDMGSFVTIKKLDDEVFGILTEALNDQSLWILICRYRKN